MIVLSAVWLSQGGSLQDPGASNLSDPCRLTFRPCRSLPGWGREKSHYWAHIGLSIFKAKAFTVVSYAEERIEV